jgi:hypothetical protein
MTKTHIAHPTIPLQDLLQVAVNMHNRTPRPSGYSPYFLMYGTILPDRLIPQAYTREYTEREEIVFQKEMAKYHEAQPARERASGLKASRDKIRSYLQEKKALMRVYAPGDWVLRTRARKHKLEPYYDGPWAIVGCHDNNTYTIRSPGGIELRNKYNGTNLFPAYVADGHPVRSYWYASKALLKQDRDRMLATV